MSRHHRLRARRAVLEKWLDSNGLSHTLSASRYLLHSQVRSAIVTEAGGRILEAGAGASPFRYLLRERGDEVVTLDLEDRQGGVDILGDIQDMDEVQSSSVDTILCTQVLEHVRSPTRAFTQMARVLKPGGVLILSAPHL